MTYNIFLDDERVPAFKFIPPKNPVTNTSSPQAPIYPPPHSWTIVRSYDQFCKVIDYYSVPDYISFDHDLGEEKTGVDCAHYLISYIIDNNIKYFPDYHVHSANPVGKENIIGLIESFKKHIIQEQQNEIQN